MTKSRDFSIDSIGKREVGNPSPKPSTLVESSLGVPEVDRDVVAFAGRPGLINAKMEVGNRRSRTAAVGDELSGRDRIVLPHSDAGRPEVGVETDGAVVVADHDVIEVKGITVGILVHVDDRHDHAGSGGGDRCAHGHFEIIRELVSMAPIHAVILQDGIGRADGIGEDVKG
jgi:hypothetical protein